MHKNPAAYWLPIIYSEDLLRVILIIIWTRDWNPSDAVSLPYRHFVDSDFGEIQWQSFNLYLLIYLFTYVLVQDIIW